VAIQYVCSCRYAYVWHCCSCCCVKKFSLYAQPCRLLVMQGLAHYLLMLWIRLTKYWLFLVISFMCLFTCHFWHCQPVAVKNSTLHSTKIAVSNCFIHYICIIQWYKICVLTRVAQIIHALLVILHAQTCWWTRYRKPKTRSVWPTRARAVSWLFCFALSTVQLLHDVRIHTTHHTPVSFYSQLQVCDWSEIVCTVVPVICLQFLV